MRREQKCGTAAAAITLLVAAFASATCLAATAQPAGPAPKLTPGYATPTVVGNINNAPEWQPRSVYGVGSTVVAGTPLRGYRAVTGGTAGTDAPSGTGGSIGDGSVTWKYLSDVDFRSIDSWIASIPAVRQPEGCYHPYYVMMRATYIGRLWNGGEYIYKNGASVVFKDHTDARFDCGEGNAVDLEDPGRAFIPSIALVAAPGESFRDRGPGLPLAYDPANGVAIHASGVAGYQNSNAAISIGDNLVTIDGLQIKNDDGNGVVDRADEGIVRNCLIDAGTTGLSFDYMSTAYNDVIIARGAFGIVSQYNNLLDHVTLVSPGRTGTIGVEMNNAGFVGPMTMRNTAVFGFRYAASLLNGGEQFSGQSDNNATDLGSGGPQNGTAVTGAMGAETTRALPGSHSRFSVPLSNANFVDAARDFRLAAGSRLIGVGAFGPANSYSADGSTKEPLYIRKHGAFDPVQTPHEVCCGEMPVYIGMTISGPGLRAGATIVAIRGSYDVNPIVPSVPVAATQAGGTYSSTWNPLDTSDIVGTPRGRSPDIGAWQHTAR